MKDKQPAFLALSEHDGLVSLWVNRTLLPGIATSLQKHQHHSLQDFSTACTQVYRGEHEAVKNDDCEIKVRQCDVGQKSTQSIAGAYLTFRTTVLTEASQAFMGSNNRAIGKIGLLFRDIQSVA